MNLERGLLMTIQVKKSEGKNNRGKGGEGNARKTLGDNRP